jgi:uncharacterized protein (DUF58 family)
MADAVTAPVRTRSRLLDPVVIARLGSMELKARTIVEGLLLGLHRSPFRGFSAEFAEYRHYLAGDDPTTIDWKVFARSDKYYVKKFEAETNLECNILVDTSASMGYGTSGITKLEYAACLAAAIAWLVSGQRDAVGLTTFDEKIVTRLPPRARSGQLHSILIALERLKAGAKSDVAKPLRQLADTLTKRGLIVLISDLLDEPEAVVTGLRYLRARGMEVVVFHVLDQAELTFPFEEAAKFTDLESSEEIIAVPGVVRAHYLEQIEKLKSRYADGLRAAGIDYQMIATATPLDAALLKYLNARGRRI